MDAKRATVRDIRRRNRAVLLSRLYFDGPLSQQDLVGGTGLSGATVSSLVGQMGEEGLIEEAGSVGSDGGRPRTLLRVRPTYGYLVGVDVGETRVRVELFDLSMGPLAKADFPLDPQDPRGRDPEPIVRHILAGLDQVVEATGVSRRSLFGVGIGVPGVVEQGREAVVHAQTFGWTVVPLEAMLRDGVGARIHIDNGAKTLGQAELWFGTDRTVRHAVVALIGSGVGAAVMTNGVSYRGASSSAGEWGHTTIVYGGRACRCGARGCLEAYVGAGGVLDRWYRARGGPGTSAVDEESEIAALLTAADTSAVAADVLHETAGYLGAGIANLINLFNPERIVLGGWAGLALGNRLLPEIRAVAAAHALRHPYAQTTIELCRLGPDAVSLGAATLPVVHLLSSGGTRPGVGRR
ncbi:ROK family transcriptional regulator [Micromonospora sagamiensis]|uniref:Putative NBD/HSP70 family sugar kinase n=1 Tax=Micromonospora sagamiensis TaxID=47875 RepID=A0A562WHM6_9ACTN|nr:ROK family transcriptional regulator [Micromonospora sagamiensis]TWJ29521.1 putative NBD/HSP70 family sugar kinase [Micromonospora sagamiensis]BCL17451.1 sugar kinase [Micromonospora sagamiensis]